MAGQPSESPREAVRFYLLDHRTAAGKVVDIGLLLLNLVFLGLYVAETYPLAPATLALLRAGEGVIAVVFLVEYVLRLYGAESRTGEALNPYTVADLVAIVPTLVLLVTPAAAVLPIGFLRIVRVVRVLRFYRFTRDAEFFFGTVGDNTLRAMKLLLTVFALLFVSAGLFYTAEVRANPAVGTFGDAFYYVVIALSTVGFGDIVPATEAGRWVTVGAVLAAVVLLPWQASRIVREWATRDKVDVTCPNCGLSDHDRDASHCKACGNLIYQEFDSRE